LVIWLSSGGGRGALHTNWLVWCPERDSGEGSVFFSEEKEAKRLFSIRRDQWIEALWFFLKKEHASLAGQR
jgi:hypothetical protein